MSKIEEMRASLKGKREARDFMGAATAPTTRQEKGETR